VMTGGPQVVGIGPLIPSHEVDVRGTNQGRL
jgi:hypothetical protein